MSALLERRDFLRGGAGLVLSLLWPQASPRLLAQGGRGARVLLKPSAYIHIGTDDTVTFVITKAEMGQGTVTSLSMLLAEELDCDWKKVRTEFASVDPALYGMQGVYGSASIRSLWNPLRQVGAMGRSMLVDAAAQRWNVDRELLRTENGFVINSATNARLSYGNLTEAAAQLPVPANVVVKDPKQFRIIGKPVKRLDSLDKINGRAKFGIDARQPGMLYASVARCPVFGGKVASFNAEKAKATPGVKNVFPVSSGVAVVAENTWAAMQGRRALQIEWDEGPNASQSSAKISRMFADLVAQPGAVAKQTGDAEKALSEAGKKLEAVYEAPYLSHAPMEPMNCTAVVRADSCEVWTSTQGQSAARQTAATVTGLKPESVQVNTLFMGGGFGRRSGADYVGESVEIAKAIPGVPVKLTWSREDDMQHDHYRPAACVKFAGAVDADGWPAVFTANVACPSFSGGGRGGSGVDSTAVEGIHTLEYAIPNFRVDYHRADAGIPTTYWRAVGYTQNTFFAESFLDELAVEGRKDPVELRRRLLEKSPRLLGVLNLAAEKANWGKPAAGRFQGVSVVNNIGSFTAQVAEVSVEKGKLRVQRVVCAVDCGHVVNPAIVRQQIESGIVYGLSAMKSAITIDKGRVQQGNFDTFSVMRIDEMPKVEVYIVESQNNPGGIGEASVPGIMPAVCNAIFAATGKRIRRLPMRAEDLVA
jgi:isoquinoline 1-oxidoreductase subunit beta